MSTALKVALLILLVQLVGALHYAVPFFVRHFAPEITARANAGQLELAAAGRDDTAGAVMHPSSLWPVIDIDDVQQGVLMTETSGDTPNVARLPLLGTEVDAQVTGLSAQTRVVQTFSNPSSQTLQGKYVFPLPPNAAVFAMRLRIGEKEIIGVIKPKAQAREAFERARREGKKASLLSQHRPDVFTTEVANIPPGAQVQVEITYQQALQVDQRTVSLRIPNAVKPRYFPAQKNVPEWARKNATSSQHDLATPNAGLAGGPIRINVLLHGNISAEQVTAGSFHLQRDKESRSGLKVETRLAQNNNRDFVLTWPLSDDNEADAVLYTERWQGMTYGLMLLTPPEQVDHQHLPPQDWHFVIDTSGSMHGAAMEQAKQALLYALDTLRPKDRFNILAFDSATQTLWHESRSVSDINKQTARTFVRGLQADGGTEIAAALSQTFAQMGAAREQNTRQQIVFLTDGSVGNEAQLMNLIRTNIGNTRLFTVGIGAAPNAYFMQEAALVGRGTYEYIDQIDQVSANMQRLIDKITRPALTEIALEMNADAQAFPDSVPDVYAGEPLQVVFSQEDPVVQIGVSGNLETQANTRWQQAVFFPVETAQSGIHRLWARQKIAALQRARRRASDKTAFNRQIEDIAIRHALVSDQTSLVAVERASETDKPVSPLARSHQAMRLPQTATPMMLSGLMGALCLSLSLFMWRRRQ